MTELPGEAPSILAEDLIRRYRNGRGLGPVSLSVARGEVVAMVGPNGSGKTTLLRCLATRSRPESGTLSWFGDDSRERARERLSVVFDSTAHADELSARENLAFFASARGVTSAQAEASLSGAEIAAGGDEPVSSYSYGMRRRLLLAEASSGDPGLLLLDEPTLGLDVQGQLWLCQLLRERAARDLTSVISTNDTGFVESAATRVCFLIDGLIIRDAPLKDLLDSLGGTTEVRISYRGIPPSKGLGQVEGVEQVAAVEGGVLILARRRDGLLADLLATLGDLDQTLVDLSVRKPGLADCFLSLTGRDLGG